MAVKFETKEIKGLKEVEQALLTLEPRMAANILRNVNKEVLRKEVRPVMRATPYRNLKVRTGGDRRDKTAGLIGVDRRSWYLRFVDRGTVDRYTRKSGAYRGRVTGQFHITNAIMGKTDDVLTKTRKEYGEIITKHLERKIRSVNKRIQKL